MPGTTASRQSDSQSQAVKRLQKKGWTVVSDTNGVLLSKKLSRNARQAMIKASKRPSALVRMRQAICGQ